MGDRKSEAWACVQLAQTLLSAASDEEKQELDLRAKAKEEKAAPPFYHLHVFSPSCTFRLFSGL